VNMAKAKEQVFTTTLSSRGQVVLPAPVRRKLRLRKGARIQVVMSDDKQDEVILKTARPKPLSAWYGAFPGAAKALEILAEERRKDRERGK